MIRRYGPILLIPAAWIVTIATEIYPGLESYWVKYMLYSMSLFLFSFALLSWRQMDSPVLKIWRYVIGTGFIFSVLGVVPFILDISGQSLSVLSISYWFLAPGFALYLSADKMDSYSTLYRSLGIGSGISFGIFAISLYRSFGIGSYNVPMLISMLAIASIQTASIVAASKLNYRKESELN